MSNHKSVTSDWKETNSNFFKPNHKKDQEDQTPLCVHAYKTRLTLSTGNTMARRLPSSDNYGFSTED